MNLARTVQTAEKRGAQGRKYISAALKLDRRAYKVWRMQVIAQAWPTQPSMLKVKMKAWLISSHAEEVDDGLAHTVMVRW